MLPTGFTMLSQSGPCEELCLAGWSGLCNDLGYAGIHPQVELLLLLDLCKANEELVVVL